MDTMLILSNHHLYTYNLRRELIERLIEEGFRVYAVCGDSPGSQLLQGLGCTVVSVPLNRRGSNPLDDVRLIRRYRNAIEEIRPDIILSFTVKPNIYGSFAAAWA